MKVTGRLTYEDLGMGVFILRTEDGVHLQLAGDVDARLIGRTVVAEGERQSAQGFGMTGAAHVLVLSEPLTAT